MSPSRAQRSQRWPGLRCPAGQAVAGHTLVLRVKGSQPPRCPLPGPPPGVSRYHWNGVPRNWGAASAHLRARRPACLAARPRSHRPRSGPGGGRAGQRQRRPRESGASQQREKGPQRLLLARLPRDSGARTHHACAPWSRPPPHTTRTRAGTQMHTRAHTGCSADQAPLSRQHMVSRLTAPFCQLGTIRVGSFPSVKGCRI